MILNDQKILPAIKSMKEFERVLGSPFGCLVFLEVHLNQLAGIVKHAKRQGHQVIFHADLIQGLKNDQYAAEYLCQVVKPDGIISTRSDMLRTAKKNRITAIQRIFLLDTLAIETGCKLADKIQPDFIEVLPGVLPDHIKRVGEDTGIPVIAGGLLRKPSDVEAALDAGAVAVTTSKRELWSMASSNPS